MGLRPGPAVRPFERGGIKFAVMKLLKDKPRHGYDIIRAMGEHSKGLYSPSAGAIYPVLQALEDLDLVASATKGGKRVYSVTPTGLAFLEENKEEAQRHEDRWMEQLATGGPGEPWRAVSDMNRTFEEVMNAVYATADDPAKRNEIREVMEEAAKKVAEIAKR
jgi:DNA-binding PadR family transcriptional regulator